MEDRYCIERGYAPDYVNESPILNSKKPYFNLLLDDRAGLGSAILQITELFKMIGICKQ